MRTTFLAVALCFGASAAAANYDATPLLSRGAWEVQHVYLRNDGASWCEASTTNRAGQSFDITMFDSGNASLFIFDQSWSLAPRTVRFRIDIDYSEWSIAGTAERTSIWVALSDKQEAGDFMAQLAEGTAVALYNEMGHRLGTFSLKGSRAALATLAECWARILASPRGVSPRDPFLSASDPF
jgi:hypothetical protein